jgi:hypothetical protein
MRRHKTFYGAQKGFYQARPIIDQDGFAGHEPVVTQNEIGGKATGNEGREAGAIATVVGDLGT